jgi:hypothetical protein
LPKDARRENDRAARLKPGKAHSLIPPNNSSLLLERSFPGALGYLVQALAQPGPLTALPAFLDLALRRGLLKPA